MRFHQLQQTADRAEVTLVLAEKGFHRTLRPVQQWKKVKKIISVLMKSLTNNFIKQELSIQKTFEILKMDDGFV